MGGFSDNYECGYWGDDAPPIQKNSKTKKNAKSKALNLYKTYIIKNDTNYQYLNILLSPIHLLSDEEQEERTNLIQLYNTQTDLELTYNKKLNIYHENVFIGSVQKIFKDKGIDNSKIVNEFCFKDNVLKDIEAFWSGDFFYLRKKTS